MSDMVIYSDVAQTVGTTNEKPIWLIYELTHEGETFYRQSTYFPEGADREAHRQELINEIGFDLP
tara:strand:+ start:482 stop:676 length:195 start_codon:yes stop_codon:yes gene_type:complete